MAKLSKLLDSYDKEHEASIKDSFLKPDEIKIKVGNKLNFTKKVFLTNVAPQIAAFHSPDSLVAENFKILRSQILHPRTGLPSRFILVTSSMPQEGKTYVSVSLAFSFAKSVPVILIESDLRRPSFSSVLGVDFSEGLSDFLLRNNDINQYIYQTDFHNLYILPAGTCLSDINDSLSSDASLKLIESLRKNFPDFFFIFDSPPVLVASETISLSRLVDGILLVVRYAVSDRDVISEALEKISKSKVLGLVFNAYMPSSLGLFAPKLKHIKYAYRYKYYKKY